MKSTLTIAAQVIFWSALIFTTGQLVMGWSR